MKSSRNIKMCHPASLTSTSSSILNFTFPVLLRLLVVLVVVPSFVQQQVYAAAAAQLQFQSPLKRFSTLPALLALLVSDVANSGQFFVQAQPPGYQEIGDGECQDDEGRDYDYIGFFYYPSRADIRNERDCDRLCTACACEVSISNPNRQFRGFTYYTYAMVRECDCHFDNDVSAFTENECRNLSAGKGFLENPSLHVSDRFGNDEIIGSVGEPPYSRAVQRCFALETTFDTSDCPSNAPSESPRPSTSASPSFSPSSSSSPTAKASKAPRASKTPKAASTSSFQVQEMKSEGGTPYSSSFSPLTMVGVCGTFAVISVTFVDLF